MSQSKYLFSILAITCITQASFANREISLANQELGLSMDSLPINLPIKIWAQKSSSSTPEQNPLHAQTSSTEANNQQLDQATTIIAGAWLTALCANPLLVLQANMHESQYEGSCGAPNRASIKFRLNEIKKIVQGNLNNAYQITRNALPLHQLNKILPHLDFIHRVPLKIRVPLILAGGYWGLAKKNAYEKQQQSRLTNRSSLIY